MIEVYAQFGMSAELCFASQLWSETEKTKCQDLANDLKLEVRAMRDETVLAAFSPQPNQKQEQEP